MAIDVIRKIIDGAYIAETTDIRGRSSTSLWTLRRLRKKARCVQTGKELAKGESHYGPLSNNDYRSWRVHRDYFENSGR